MLSIGARVCKWTTLLLLCSCSIPGQAQPANGTTHDESREHVSVPSSSTTTIHGPPSPVSSLKSAALDYADSTCGFRTINYITHTLPQQCLKTAWSAPTQSATVESYADGEAPPSSTVAILSNESNETTVPGPQASGSFDRPTASSAHATQSEPEIEIETDSPLDNANFLSFEEWKKKNLVRAGQSLENVRQGRAAASEDRARRRPVNVNALDSLGEESEIEIDFGGFGNPAEEADRATKAPSGTERSEEATKATEDEDNVAPSSWALSKDAGKTCKERFNYASFDCAATVLKTNSKVKGSTAILVENKDSYLLNECSAQNKFIIVELCDDILVDTVVLANYEFFSSMFRHFRVSVSDRYPVKSDRWRVLDTFEARNTREVQPFLVKAPQIWARYLRIEFLTHYGNEFYCPLSLLRVHGTTMMEQFRREEEEARGDDDYTQPIEAAEGDPVVSASGATEDDGYVPTGQVSVDSVKEADPPEPTTAADKTSSAQPADTNGQESTARAGQPSTEIKASDAASSVPSNGSNVAVILAETEAGKLGTPSSRSSVSQNSSEAWTSAASSTEEGKRSTSIATTNVTQAPVSSHSSSKEESVAVSSPSSRNGKGDSQASINDTSNTSSVSTSTKAASNSTTSTPTQKESQSRPPSQSRPDTATPTTQESFFKSIHKRLQQLEVNSTLSLQYIEEQSRILRDAFIKVEKRQLSKTEKFLDHLNSTVVQELKSYRSMYDQLWQSTILELEGMKERQKAEIGEIGTRLSLVADELVWQKRMAVVQSTLLLLCLGLVLFVRSGPVGGGVGQGDVPIMQQLGNKYKYTRFFDTPPGTPDARSSITGRKRRGFRSMWRSDTSGLSEQGGHMTSDAETDGRRSPVGIEFSPPTPPETLESPPLPASNMRGRVGTDEIEIEKEMGDINTGLPTPTPTITDIDNEVDTELDADGDADSDQQKRIQVLATQSGPATPRGSRDSRPSWEEVERAVGLLKAEEQNQNQEQGLGLGNGKKKTSGRRGKRFGKRRSPLRRSESYDGVCEDGGDGDGIDVGVDDSPGEDEGGEGGTSE